MRIAGPHEDAELTMNISGEAGQQEVAEITIGDLGEGVVDDTGLGAEFEGGFDVVHPSAILDELASAPELLRSISMAKKDNGQFFTN